jgi:hypothetical protein
MLSILFLLLWQLLTLTLTGVVYYKQRNSGFLLVAGLLLLQILANIFQLEVFSSNPLFFRIRYAISALSVAGYAFLFLRHLKHPQLKQPNNQTRKKQYMETTNTILRHNC